jgi:guanosine-3',5'-bis(diphosphate) 3'-pyrophosphohydrolase
VAWRSAGGFVLCGPNDQRSTDNEPGNAQLSRWQTINDQPTTNPATPSAQQNAPQVIPFSYFGRGGTPIPEARKYHTMTTQSLYQQAIVFAAAKHVEMGQTIPGTNLPYVVHLSNVAMEILIAAPHTPNFQLDFAIQVALLHDTLEDTSATLEEISNRFGPDIAQGVSALTKNDALPKAEKMPDSLKRIKELQPEVWAVKLADRITNLQKPPGHWDSAKIAEYRQESIHLLRELKGGNAYLEKRLQEKIAEYEQYMVS